MRSTWSSHSGALRCQRADGGSAEVLLEDLAEASNLGGMVVLGMVVGRDFLQEVILTLKSVELD